MGEKRGNYSTELMERLDYNTLCKLVSEGKGDDEIAEMYFVARSTIFRVRQVWGILKPKNPEKYNWEMVKRMLECNLTYEDIAHVYQVEKTHITKYISRKRIEEEKNNA